MDNASDEFTVVPKLTAPPSVVRTVSTPKVTAFLKSCAPVVVTEPPFSNVVPEPFTVSAARALLAAPAPTVPAKVVMPLPVTVKALAELPLLTVRFSAMSVPMRVVLPVSVTTPSYVCVPSVVIAPFSEIPFAASMARFRRRLLAPNAPESPKSAAKMVKDRAAVASLSTSPWIEILVPRSATFDVRTTLLL